MTEQFIKVEITGAKGLQAALRRFPQQSERYMQQAGDEAAKEILGTVGVQQYPPSTSANAPPTPYYVRGHGTETAHGNRHNSERYGASWTVKPEGYGVLIGNKVSYAKYLTDEQYQAVAMSAQSRIPKGWRKIIEVVHEKMPEIIVVFDKWINKLLTDVGLK